MSIDGYNLFCKRTGIETATARAALQGWQLHNANPHISGEEFLAYCKSVCFWNGQYGENRQQVACYIEAWAMI